MTLVGFYIIPTQIPFYLADSGYPAPSATAWAQAATTFAAGVLSLLYGRIRPAIGAGATSASGFALMAAGFAALSRSEDLWAILASCAAIGAGSQPTRPTSKIVSNFFASVWPPISVIRMFAFFARKLPLFSLRIDGS